MVIEGNGELEPALARMKDLRHINAYFMSSVVEFCTEHREWWGAFDYVTVFKYLIHPDEITDFFQSIGELLKPSGTLVMTVVEEDRIHRGTRHDCLTPLESVFQRVTVTRIGNAYLHIVASNTVAHQDDQRHQER